MKINSWRIFVMLGIAIICSRGETHGDSSPRNNTLQQLDLNSKPPQWTGILPDIRVFVDREANDILCLDDFIHDPDTPANLLRFSVDITGIVYLKIDTNHNLSCVPIASAGDKGEVTIYATDGQTTIAQRVRLKVSSVMTNRFRPFPPLALPPGTTTYTSPYKLNDYIVPATPHNNPFYWWTQKPYPPGIKEVVIHPDTSFTIGMEEEWSGPITNLPFLVSPHPPVPTPTPTPLPTSASVYGNVYDAYIIDPISKMFGSIPNATVTLGDRTTQTDRSGYYQFDRVSLGDYTIVFEAQWYNTISRDITVLEFEKRTNAVMTKLARITLDLPNLQDRFISLKLVWIPPGVFMIGSPDEEEGRCEDEGPVKEIEVGQDFYIGAYEVTQAQWKSVMNNNPSYFKDRPDHPVENVNVDDCQRFLDRLSEMFNGNFSLPTEALWEYCCRAGSGERYYWGDDLDYVEINDNAWYEGNNWPFGTKSVGLLSPNFWGLYDMSGNVWEWCQDKYNEELPSGAFTVNTKGAEQVIRGGSWNMSPLTCRSALRSWSSPSYIDSSIGFRIVFQTNIY